MHPLTEQDQDVIACSPTEKRFEINSLKNKLLMDAISDFAGMNQSQNRLNLKITCTIANL